MPAHRFTNAIISALFILFALSFPSKSTAADHFTVSGTGYATPFMNHPQTLVVVRDKLTMVLL